MSDSEDEAPAAAAPFAAPPPPPISMRSGEIFALEGGDSDDDGYGYLYIDNGTQAQQ